MDKAGGKDPERMHYVEMDDTKLNAVALSSMLQETINRAGQLRAAYQKQKISVSWMAYKAIMESFFQKILKNCRPVDLCGDTTFWNMYDFINEDNYYTKYFCKSLTTYMRNYQKSYYGLKRTKKRKYRYCTECGGLFEIKNTNDRSAKYCNKCRIKKRQESYIRYNRKRDTYKAQSST